MHSKKLKNKKEVVTKADGEITTREKLFCPVCGSTLLRPLQEGGFACMNCKSRFYIPKKAMIFIRKKPRYIG